MQELEKERDFLQSRVHILERTNKEMASMQKSLEETIKEISNEED